MMLQAKVSEYRVIVSEFKGKVSLYPTRDETRWKCNENRRVNTTNMEYVKAC